MNRFKTIVEIESQKEYLLHANDRLGGPYNPESEINSFDKENIRKLLNLK